MEPFRVVKPNISCQTLARVPHALIIAQIHLLVFHAAPQPLDNTWSKARPRPSRPTVSLRAAAAPCSLDWSTGPLVGVKDLRLALAQRLLQRLDTACTIQVIDTAQDRTYRRHQSITATRDTHPAASRTSVISALHTWLTRSTLTPRQRYGSLTWSAAGWLSRGLGSIAAHPICRSSRPTRIDRSPGAATGRHPPYPIERVADGASSHRISARCSRPRDGLVIQVPPPQTPPGAWAPQADLRVLGLYQRACLLTGEGHLFFSANPARLSPARCVDRAPPAALPPPWLPPPAGKPRGHLLQDHVLPLGDVHRMDPIGAANSWIVRSPRIASRATLALTSARCCRRCLVITARSSRAPPI